MNGLPVISDDDGTDAIWEEIYQPQSTALARPPSPRWSRRRRWLLGLFGCVILGVLAVAGSGALIVHSANDLIFAIQHHDRAALERDVVWDRLEPALRRDLKTMASGADAEPTASTRYLAGLIDTTARAARDPGELAEVLSSRMHQSANYAPINPRLSDLLASIQLLDGAELRLDMIADPYTVVSGISFCIRPALAGVSGTKLLSVGWPETSRRC